MNIIILLVCVTILATNTFIQAGRTKETFNLTGEEQEFVVNDNNLTLKPISSNIKLLSIGKMFVIVLSTLLIVDIILFNS